MGFQRVCLLDNDHITYYDKKLGVYQWYKYKDGFICLKCRNKLIANPKWHPLTNPKRLRFKDKHIFTKINPRTGYCSKCPNNIFDGSCQKTDLHHIEYHEDDPLLDTIELCVSCHDKETIRLKKQN